MTFGTLIRRSLRFHAWAHAGVALGAAIGSAALIGALVVGDSVRGTLRQRAVERLGRTQTALSGGDRLFRAELADRLTSFFRIHAPELGAVGAGAKAEGCIAPVLRLSGVMAARGGASRANHVQVLGVDARFWQLGNLPPRFVEIPDGGVILNRPLAEQLGLRCGDEVIARLSQPGALSRELPISASDQGRVAQRLRVHGIVSGAELGSFSLRGGPAVPFNAFVSLRQLQGIAGATNRANLLLSPPAFRLVRRPAFPARDLLQKVVSKWLSPRLARGITLYRVGAVRSASAAAELQQALAAEWALEDAGLQLQVLPEEGVVELRSPRVFVDAVVGSAVLGAGPNKAESGRAAPADFEQRPRLATNAQPILTYLANLLRTRTNATPYSMVTAAGPPYTPAGMADDEIVVNEWLAQDLGMHPGDWIEMTYFLPDSGVNLVEVTNRFRVRAVVPLAGIYADRTLMPDFPGIEKAESTRDWDAGFRVDLKRIRPKDEAYWKEHRGTPKAFVTLAAGQKMWGNRFGDVTAIRFPVPAGVSAEEYKEALSKALLQLVRPSDIGLRFEPVRDQALKAAAQGQDFGQLFLGFSLFLVVAALVLMGLLFQLGLEQRAAEVGILLALGLTPRQVRRLLLLEGSALALVGGLIGALGGIGYAKAMLWGLRTVWRSAVGGAELEFHATAASLCIGLCASMVVAVVTLWVTLRKQARQPARELLAGQVQSPKAKGQSRAVWVAVVSGLAAGGTVGWAVASGRQAEAGVFFSAGALLLVAGLAGAAAWLRRLAGEGGTERLTLGVLAVRGCARRRKRSVATIALLACGVFVVAAVGVFRLDADRDGARREAGTGGFALIGESTMPVVQDLNTKAGREFYGLDAKELAGVNVVPLRVREGDVANCLNLNRAQRPRLLGVRPELLKGRFTFAGVAKGCERGRAFKVRLVGAVANSILQGSLLVDEAEFTRRFPGESGYRMFLLDAPSNAVAEVSATLSRALADAGLELTPAARRLNEFNAVQNTYLGTFQVLGGLGLLLGSAGLGVVVLRNVLERRGELGLLLAVGFKRRGLRRLVLGEHGALLGLGLGLGIAAAAVAVLPAVLSPGTQLPVGSLAFTLGAVLLNGLVWTWLATGFALRGNLLEALRNE